MAIFVAFSATAVMAQTDEVSPEKEENIRQNCVSSQVTLQRIQYSDAATRVNRGQIYEGILSKFITPLNSRVAGNRLSEQTTKLSEVTSRYQNSLQNFKKSYDLYDDAIESSLQVKCQEKPLSFYKSLQSAQKQRAELSTDAAELDQIIEEYRHEVAELRKIIE